MHLIRLRAAWTIDGGRAERRFNRPTGLGTDTVVWIAWDGPACDADLNGAPLDESYCCGPARFDVTHRLAASNVLRLGTDNGAVLETVRLEIEEPESE